ncbi:hypothetical protein [Coleofasciculus sp. FACHB-129]|nr:hypothetical protein [Coleofasciculus sp. FACHB-129]
MPNSRESDRKCNTHITRRCITPMSDRPCYQRVVGCQMDNCYSG